MDHTVGLHTGIYSENHLGNDENHNQFMTSMVCKAIFGGNKHGMIQTRCCCFLARTSGTFYTCRCSTCILLLHYQDEGNIIDIMIGLPQTTTRGSVIWRCGSMLQYSYTKAILKQAAKSQRHQASNNCLITEYLKRMAQPKEGKRRELQYSIYIQYCMNMTHRHPFFKYIWETECTQWW